MSIGHISGEIIFHSEHITNMLDGIEGTPGFAAADDSQKIALIYAHVDEEDNEPLSPLSLAHFYSFYNDGLELEFSCSSAFLYD